MRIGAVPLGEDTCRFTVWAPFRQSVELHLLEPEERLVPLKAKDQGYWSAEVKGVSPGALYFYRLDREIERPDPASSLQPRGVHGPSQVVDHLAFAWNDSGWGNLPLEEMIFYEIHTGSFTPEGTFQAIISRLEDLRRLGANTLSLMPVTQFPGSRNWGYDGVQPFAVHRDYGGPEELQRLINACHERGLAVVIDVVYNHLGPEGNYHRDFGPYFTDVYRTPWGDAVNVDGPYSDEVRNYFYQNALFWMRCFHVDGLRLDAVHAIFDQSAHPFLQELAENVEQEAQRLNKPVHLIPESDLNDARLIRPRSQGGLGHSAQWADDFHHALHTLLTNERSGYYQDFGKASQLKKCLEQGYVYTWDYSPFRKRRHGSSPQDRPGRQFVVYSQNHDQVGNRRLGERLSQLASFEALKLAAGTVLLSPFLPLLFMGEEYGETAPFLYFVSHSDPELVDKVREGRKREFQHFGWREEPPDPQAEETFLRSRIDWEARWRGSHNILLTFYQQLLHLRKTLPGLKNLSKCDQRIWCSDEQRALWLLRWKGDQHLFLAFNFNTSRLDLQPELPRERWVKLLESSDQCWSGPGAGCPEVLLPDQELSIQPQSFAVFAMRI